MSYFSRRRTREIKIGSVPMGGSNPIRIQSMTNTPTEDIKSTVEQVIRLADLGCEYVRITTPGIKEVECLYEIKNLLRKQNYNIPLIADIHYSPKVAELAAKYVEKIRINPGNYTDRNKGKIHFSEEEYRFEIDQIAEKLERLISICKVNGTAIRIGTNHGSLSERIVSRYGNTALGMAQSAIEFIHIFRRYDFHNLVLSMKASHVNTMIYATRCLTQFMQKEGFDYPIHLGVTEAGDGIDGRIRSACGIGALLGEGIGDTIRVSLTEAPEQEIDIARMIANFYHYPISETFENTETISYTKRETEKVLTIGGDADPIIMTINPHEGADYFFLSKDRIGNSLGEEFPCFYSYESFKKGGSKSKIANFIWIGDFEEIKEIMKEPAPIILLACFVDNRMEKIRALFHTLKENDSKVVVLVNFSEDKNEECFYKEASMFSYFFANGWVDGVVCHSDIGKMLALLQAVGRRISKAEFISCPSCGRTQYDIEKTLREIKGKTAHLVGVKIAVMGCVVNGPGEMADAHYGYVGSGKGKVCLYKGGKVVKKDITSENAILELVELIKESGDWVEP